MLPEVGYMNQERVLKEKKWGVLRGSKQQFNAQDPRGGCYRHAYQKALLDYSMFYLTFSYCSEMS